MDKLPRYEVSIDQELSEDELGWDITAFTANPAVRIKGMAYKSQLKPKCFADELKYRITAPAMIPMDIYRSDEDGEYEVTFTEQVIEDIFVKFMANMKNNNLFNIEHNSDEIAPAYILEAWIVQNPKEDKAFSTYGIEVPKGTLMLTAQVTDKDFYHKLVENEQTGFSIEAMLAMQIPKEQLNKYSMNLPNGNFNLNGKTYSSKDGVVVEVAFTEEEVKEEEVVMEDEVVVEEKEEEMEEVVEEEVVEEVKEEMAIDPTTDAEAILAIVTPLIDEKINELLQVIAELKNELADSVDGASAEDVEVEMTAHQRFSNVIKFLKSNG